MIEKAKIKKKERFNLHHVDLIEMDAVLQFKKESERFPWKCHRRWVVGKLVESGWDIIHIIERGKIWVLKIKIQGSIELVH
jgi:uncharacterized protein (DUF488 family)